MVEMILPAITSMMTGQGVVADGPCGYSSACARDSFLRISQNAGLENALSVQALDLATGKSELIDLDPIGMTKYRVQKTHYKDKTTGEVVWEKTLVSPDFNGEPIGVWMDAGEYGMGTKEEYRRILNRANTLAQKDGDAAMFWVSPGNEDSRDPLPHRAYLWVKKDDEVTAYSYSLPASRETLERFMRKLGADGKNKPLEEQTIVRDNNFFSHKEVFNAFSSAMLPQEIAGSVDFIKRFKREVELPDEVRIERLKAYKETYEAELREKYEKELKQALESISPGFFQAVSKSKPVIGELASQNYVLAGQMNKEVHKGGGRLKDQTIISSNDTSTNREAEGRKATDLFYGKKSARKFYEAISGFINPLTIRPSFIKSIKTEDLFPVEEEAEVEIKGTEGKMERQKTNDDGKTEILMVKDIMQDIAYRIFSQDELLALPQLGEYESKGDNLSLSLANNSRNDTGIKSDIATVFLHGSGKDVLISNVDSSFLQNSSFDAAKEAFDDLEPNQNNYHNERINDNKMPKRILAQATEELSLKESLVSADEGDFFDMVSEELKIVALFIGKEVAELTDEEIAAEGEIINLGRELFKILYIKSFYSSKKEEGFEVVNESEENHDSLFRLGVFLGVYFDRQTTPLVKNLLSFFILNEVKNILMKDLFEDLPELTYVCKRFEALPFKIVANEERLGAVIYKLRLILKNANNLAPIIFSIFEGTFVEEDECTIERLKKPNKMLFKQFGRKKAWKSIPRQGVIYHYALVVNTGHFMTQYN